MGAAASSFRSDSCRRIADIPTDDTHTNTSVPQRVKEEKEIPQSVIVAVRMLHKQVTDSKARVPTPAQNAVRWQHLPERPGLLLVYMDLTLETIPAFLVESSSKDKRRKREDIYVFGLTSDELNEAVASVEVLALSHNPRLVSLPLSFSQLLCSSLKVLNCIKCGFENFLPESLTQLVELEELRIMANKRLTTLPNLAGLRNLRLVDFSDNALDEFPRGLVTLPALRNLNLSSNQLTDLAADIGLGVLASSLEVLNISSNPIKMLPDSLCDLSRLRELICTRVYLSQLPSRLGDLCSLQKLDAGSVLMDSFPAGIGYMHQLERLELGCCRPKYLPDSLRFLLKLSYVHLDCSKIMWPPPSVLPHDRFTFDTVRDYMWTHFDYGPVLTFCYDVLAKRRATICASTDRERRTSMANVERALIASFSDNARDGDSNSRQDSTTAVADVADTGGASFPPADGALTWGDLPRDIVLTVIRLVSLDPSSLRKHTAGNGPATAAPANAAVWSSVQPRS